MSSAVMTALSVAEALLLVAVLVVALVKVERRLRTIAGALGHLGTGLGNSERQLRDLDPAVETVNAPLRDMVGGLPQIAELAESMARR